MKVKFLGTGTSHGIPVIGCSCPTCTSKDPRNQRYRTGLYIQDSSHSFIIDTPPEFRLRALEYKIQKIDAVLFTHAHSDHCAGLDDIRRFNELQNSSIPVYGNEETLSELRKKFSYVFEETQEGGGKPKLDLKLISDFETLKLGKLNFIGLPVYHGELKILGYRIGGFAFITDVSKIPEETFSRLKDLEILVLDALRIEKHPTHFNLEEAIEAAFRIGAQKTYFTHITHILEHESTEKVLPQTMFLAYDGLELFLKDSGTEND
ncbi:MAG: MBL fold metallo-hydrolase [Leptospiraceae bacterium]|nr:MBL fold metallo-hydrolase [Leptospiraceae bacterium]MCP5513194.1 MBL fold metallo-hydrolase [Leptospiraceae bacterium]